MSLGTVEHAALDDLKPPRLYPLLGRTVQWTKISNKKNIGVLVTKLTPRRIQKLELAWN